MLILAVDTNTYAGSVALLSDRRLMAEVNLDSPQTHSERLLPSIDMMLQLLGVKLEHIDGYALAVGPGSFTGIRIGMSTVKALAFASGKPIAPVSNLEALALKIRQPQARVLCPFMDAKKGEVYAALYEAKAGALEVAVPESVYKPDRFFTLLPSNRIVTFIGSGVPVCREKIVQYFSDKARFSSRTLYIAHEVALLGSEILRAGRGLDAFRIEPLYFRKSQAEESHK
jgi:tRNA threonylcarbamoyladenosine biosynthesis protein TsaB